MCSFLCGPDRRGGRDVVSLHSSPFSRPVRQRARSHGGGKRERAAATVRGTPAATDFSAAPFPLTAKATIARKVVTEVKMCHPTAGFIPLSMTLRSGISPPDMAACTLAAGAGLCGANGRRCGEVPSQLRYGARIGHRGRANGNQFAPFCHESEKSFQFRGVDRFGMVF